ncbi:MAG: twin-arginine translocase subunit TatC [Desulfurococcales archaeon]|nr:twin-arginine translocase subunit TatC [Desulfurococcales archaeon]
MSGDNGPFYDEPRPIWSHVAELSLRLRRIFISVIIAGAVLSAIPIDYKYYIPLISYFPDMVLGYVLPDQVVWRGRVIEVHIAQYNPFAGFNILLKTALLLGLLGASPVIAREIYGYIAPGLYPYERRKVKIFSVFAVILFALGVVVAFTIVMPLAFRIMIITSTAVTGEKTLIAFSDVEQLFTTIILIAVATGIAFETPLIVYLLVSLAVIDHTWFVGENRKYVLLASMLLGAAISPDPSGIGMMVIGTAMFAAIMVAAWLGSRSAPRGRGQGRAQRIPGGEAA